MKKQTVKRRFFLSNAQMILTTLLVILAINAAAIKAYSEYIEHVTESPVGSAADEEELEALLKEYTIRKNEFILLLFADGCLCAAALVLVSGVFTRKLARHIMEPLDALADGAQRIRNNDLTQEIAYTGDTEFENVCHAFDGMQKAILAGQEKNRAYEKARTEMIAGISHDLRTPLTAARGATKGVLDGVAAAPEQQRRFWKQPIDGQRRWSGCWSGCFTSQSWKPGTCRLSWKPSICGSLYKTMCKKTAAFGK